MRLLSSSGCMLARFFGSQGAHAVGHLLRTLHGFQLASATCRSKTELGKALACALLMEDTAVLPHAPSPGLLELTPPVHWKPQ